MSGPERDGVKQEAVKLLGEAQQATGSVDELRESVRGLWDDLGSTDHNWLGVAINGSMVLAGVWAAVAFSGWLAAAGVAWAVFNGYPLVAAVVRWLFR